MIDVTHPLTSVTTVLLALLLSIRYVSTPVVAGTIERTAPARASTADPVAERKALMTIKVVPRSKSGAFRDTAVVYLDGPIDPDAPNRLSRVLARVNGTITVWLNSAGGNLFAGMEMGRLIRAHRASTHIIDFRTLLPGECYSACAMAFLGGVSRFTDYGRYGVHRASLRVSSTTGDLDLGQDLSAAIGIYIREMGVDARLLDLWMKAAPDEMYVLSQQEARDLGVVDDGRRPPEWSISSFPGGTMLQGQQATLDGTGTVFFSCDESRTIFGSVYESRRDGTSVAAARWRHVLTIDGYGKHPLKPLTVSTRNGVARATFILPTDVVRLARSANQIGYGASPAGMRSLAIDYSVDVDVNAASMVRTFLGDCLRAQGVR